MRLEPVTLQEFDGCDCCNIKLSERLRWRESVQEDPHIMIPSLLAVCVKENGSPVKSVDEWDEWAGDNPDGASEIFNQCLNMIGTVDSAKKK